VAEWLKMALATQAGVCAATRVELPARFLWRAYRQVLGRAAVPAVSPLDKLPLTWRLMQTLPQVVAKPGFEPLAGFLQRGGMDRRLRWRLRPTSTSTSP
jgi:exodeoxyribonuclease V gamma subunit